MDQREEHRKRCNSYFEALFNSAWKKRPLEFLFTILRVNGIQDEHWDPMEESLEAFDDLTSLLKSEILAEKLRTKVRLSLAIYCHAIEMSSVHETLLNLFRCRRGESFTIKPFSKLYQKRKVKSIPPSAKTKFKYLCEFAQKDGDQEFCKIFSEFFDENIRNSYSHSDYIIADDEYRWTEGTNAISLSDLSQKLETAFAFYEVFFAYLNTSLKALSKAKRFHKLPNYETLEYLSEKDKLMGFKIHFSNGSSAVFSRKSSGVKATNLFFENDGSVNFMIGDLGKQTRKWKINGVEVSNWDEVNGKN